MKRYPFSAVPNNKKLSHFFTYYKLETYLVCFTIVVVGYMGYLALFAPKTDVFILWISNTYSLEADGLVNERFDSLDWDHNDDGKSTVMIQHAEFGKSFEETNADSQISLMTILSAGDTDILLVSEAALEWGLQMELFGTYQDFGWNFSGNDHEVLIIPCDSLTFFEDTGISAYEPMYLTIAKPREDPEANARYTQNMNALKTLLEWEK